ncbi:MAG: PSP1 domain-containing protein [Christensenellales bacterium]
MANVVGVRFKNAGKLYYFNPSSCWPSAGDLVIVETTRGVELGEVVVGISEVDDADLTAPLKNVLRIATQDDVEQYNRNLEKAADARPIVLEKIQQHQLDMKLVGIEYTFDLQKLIIYFTSDGRVDFRQLVKDLAYVFKARIELKQIGVRDEAKMIGGLGACGRNLCCSTFLGDFQPVSIKMAKEQNLSLNPTKISGMCGRLMCCLKYEQEFYEKTRKTMPRVGRDVQTPDGIGTVIELNILKNTVKVRLKKEDDLNPIKDYEPSVLRRLDKEDKYSDGKQQKQQAIEEIDESLMELED